MKTIVLTAVFLIFCVSASAQNNPQGQPYFTCDPSLQNAWCALKSYDGTTNPFPGPVLSFQAQNKAGNWFDAVALNGGFIDPTPGKEQGDLDIVTYVDGQLVTVAIQGKWSGQPPGLLPWPADIMWLGGAVNRWAGLGLTEVSCPASVPKGPKTCVRLNGGGFLPVYR